MKRFRNILCAVDIEKPSGAALARAAELAEANQADLMVVDVAEAAALEPGFEGDAGLVELQRLLLDERAQRLAAWVEPYREHLAVHTGLLTGTPHQEIVRAVLRGGYDIVVRVAEQPGWLGRLFGNDDMNLLRKCPCPVWLTRPHERGSYRRILAAVDVDSGHPPQELETRRALNRETLDIAFSLAASHLAELHIVHVWDALGEGVMRGAFISEPEDRIAAYVERVRQRHANQFDALLQEKKQRLGVEAVGYLSPQMHLLKGSPRREIPALAKHIEADVVIMGTVARTGIPGFIMGNTAETILDQLDCSVLAIKPPGFVSPVGVEG